MTAALAEPQTIQATLIAHQPAPPNPYRRTRKVLGDPTPLICTVAKTAVEVVQGGTGLASLARWIAPNIRSALSTQGGLAARAGKAPHGPARVLRVRIYRCSETAAEASIVVDDGIHVRAVAAHLEDMGGRWLTTALEVG